ncbi:hypothetical protein B0T25DRAFT_540570 [Lasiosphaeria hispida]|uniref:Uncharacterized protein n=1 Tax=Lasiosphaeria hispida TaxID=260671 RepID=A0AAJ0MGL5_9PEZI|nr:hypothetical protein B0T25DRAFT_540570 [Lasiosphaeria hispida]
MDSDPGNNSGGVGRLTLYLAAVGLAHVAPEIHAAIAQGAQDVYAIMTQPWTVDEIWQLARNLRNSHSSACAIQVTGIVWYLTSLAIERNQAFVTGAYLCRDPNGRLSAYFRGVSMPRISSHLKRHSAPGCTGGIDLRVADSAVRSRLPPLPHGHCHVLSIAIANDKRRGNCLFLKPERYGVHGVRNLAHHAVMYAKSLRRKHTFGGNEVAGMRKERIPDQLVASFAEAVASLPDGPSAIAEVGRRGEGEGIASMHDFLTVRLADPSAAGALSGYGSERMRALLDRLVSEYDFVDLRFGNEVFIDLPADLTRPFPQTPGVCGPSLFL